jgi:hypothetical protein
MRNQIGDRLVDFASFVILIRQKTPDKSPAESSQTRGVIAIYTRTISQTL